MDVASTSKMVNDIADAADGGPAMPTMADRHVFLHAERSPEDDSLVEESAPSTHMETYNRQAVNAIPRSQPELELNTKKSPISIVNEIMLRQKEEAHYNLISAIGKMHRRKFTYCLKYNNIKVYGNGKSKKEAKKNTAIAFLKKINYVNNTKTSTLNTARNKKKNNDNQVGTVVGYSKLNYIGMLQELCMSRHWELPRYEFCKNEFAENTWSGICSVQFYKSKGVDKFKRTAKNKSAYVMYKNIKDLPQKEIPFLNYHEFQNMNNCNNSLTDITTLAKCMGSSDGVKMFPNLWKSKKTCINNLKMCNSISELNMSSVDILKKIGEEEGFNVEFVVNIVNNYEKYEVFVKLSLTPILTHMCSGNVMEEIQEAAAFDVLSYFKLLLATP